ncbi:uncharacterized protein LOC131666187 isoform X2 [Phymastichus coffea]|nr:uncharacterized protein LOC131666187 isoform X2 [Phymastichus coffea]XP_058794601.1 uncharacterized protein LOC131666187 isoform X2 [Phymastichus coffea]
MMILLLCLITSHYVIAMPYPIPPGMIYREDYGLEEPNQMLVERLKQIVERKEEKINREIDELAEDQMEIQALIDAKVKSEQEQRDSEEDPESLPLPAAIYHNAPLRSGKRTSYMALCHFKICNMGRKRQM